MAWHLLRSGGPTEEYGFAHKDFLIDSTSDVNSEPREFGPIAPGSMAHTAGYQNIYEKDYSGTWREV